MLGNRRSSGCTKASHWLSGAHEKLRISHTVDCTTCVTAAFETSTKDNRFFLSVHAIFEESGDHSTPYLYVSPSFVS